MLVVLIIMLDSTQLMLHVGGTRGFPYNVNNEH